MPLISQAKNHTCRETLRARTNNLIVHRLSIGNHSIATITDLICKALKRLRRKSVAICYPTTEIIFVTDDIVTSSFVLHKACRNKILIPVFTVFQAITNHSAKSVFKQGGTKQPVSNVPIAQIAARRIKYSTHCIMPGQIRSIMVCPLLKVTTHRFRHRPATLAR